MKHLEHQKTPGDCNKDNTENADGQSEGKTACPAESSCGTDFRSLTGAERRAALVRTAMNTCLRMEQIAAALKKNVRRPDASVAPDVPGTRVKRCVKKSNDTKGSDCSTNDEENSPVEWSSGEDKQQQPQQQQNIDEFARKNIPHGTKYLTVTKKKVYVRRIIREGDPLTSRGGFDSTENASPLHQRPRRTVSDPRAPLDKRPSGGASPPLSSTHDEPEGTRGVEGRGSAGTTSAGRPGSQTMRSRRLSDGMPAVANPRGKGGMSVRTGGASAKEKEGGRGRRGGGTSGRGEEAAINENQRRYRVSKGMQTDTGSFAVEDKLMDCHDWRTERTRQEGGTLCADKDCIADRRKASASGSHGLSEVVRAASESDEATECQRRRIEPSAVFRVRLRCFCV